jgi:hypothetical protein
MLDLFKYTEIFKIFRHLIWSRTIDLYLWAIAVITSPLLQNGEYNHQLITEDNHQFVNATYSGRMECEVELHKFILKNKPFAENQVVRCLKIDELIDRPGKFYKQKNR